MPEIGQTVSHYRISEKLGAGGMGEVFLAQDASLDRNVALKFLPDIFSGDPERLARFEREAKLLASLNHTNIATIYGLEQADGKRFLAMELVEGETLAQQIARGPLPVNEALEVCRQIAEGLEAAHEKGIIHRDLKPANVKITPEGKVKILDFGLAKALQDEMPVMDASKSPTLTDQMTCAGVILGTAAYMSPEQTKGKPVDKRSDIWAFGCVLYECLTAKRAFEGATLSETMASILKTDPDWTALPGVIAPGVKNLLRNCLTKDPKNRLREIADMRIFLQDASSVEPEPAAKAEPYKIRRRALPWILFAVMTSVAVVAVLQNTSAPEKPPMPPRHLAITLPEPMADWEIPCLAISPDGMQIAYFAGSVSSGSVGIRLYCLRLDQNEFKLRPGAEGGYSPFFSPDGKEIAFFSGRKLKKLPVDGGATTTLTDVLGASPGAGSWDSDGFIYFSPSWGGGIARVRESGGTPETILKPDAGRNERGLLWSQRLPKDDLLLVTAFRGDILSMMDANIALGRIGNKTSEPYIAGGTHGRYFPTGHLVYAYDNNLMAIGLDLTRQKQVTEASKVLEGIEVAPNTGAAQYAVSKAGDLVYAPGSLIKCRDSLMQIGRGGGRNQISFPTGENEDLYVSSPSLSWDGKRMAVMLHKANNDIHIYDISRNVLTRESYEAGDKWAPVWTPDGSGLLYTAEPGPVFQIIKKQVAGSAKSEPICPSENPRYPWAFSRDGKILAFVEITEKTKSDIWTVQATGGGQAKPFKNTASSETYPAFSPDGQWIAYESDRSGQKQVYVARYPDGSDEKQISQAGGTEPRWALSGEIFYLSGHVMKVVKTRLDPTLSVEAATDLFTVDDSLFWAFDFPVSSYAVSSDGQKFYFIKKNRAAPVTQLRVVLNWFEELRRLCPTGKK